MIHAFGLAVINNNAVIFGHISCYVKRQTKKIYCSRLHNIHLVSGNPFHC